MNDEIVPAGLGRTLVVAWLVTALSDAIFASALTLSGTPPTVAGEWRAIAATALGSRALDSATLMVIAGVVVHLAVALWWTAVFVALVRGSRRLRAMLVLPGGTLAVAVVYGPLVWLVMSGLAIPVVTRRALHITDRWWLLLAGHVLFVALPMATVVARWLRGSSIESGGETAPAAD